MRRRIIKSIDDLDRLRLNDAKLIGCEPRFVDAITAALLDPVKQSGDGVDERIVEIEGDRLRHLTSRSLARRPISSNAAHTNELRRTAYAKPAMLCGT